MADARVQHPIRRLSERLVNRIAAGEVIERPAAVVKELIENALDAGATRIAVALEGGGIARIVVEDDGCGMDQADLLLAVQRHCTSKLPDLADAHPDHPDTLVRITTLGFRGEALPSIGAAARLEITSRPRPPTHEARTHGVPPHDGPSHDGPAGANTAYRLSVEGGHVGVPEPVGGASGTRIVVSDLFFATPARRKFLKSPRTEAEHAEQATARLAFAAPATAFRLEIEGRVVFDLPPQTEASRVAALLGVQLRRDIELLPVRAERGGLRMAGFIAPPSHSRATPAQQSLVVNGRPVADPVLRLAVRIAYREVIEAGRHPIVALYFDVPAETLDVNVHPAKTELRFQDPAALRALVIGGLRAALAGGAGAALPHPLRPAFTSPAFTGPAFAGPAFAGPAFAGPAFAGTSFSRGAHPTRPPLHLAAPGPTSPPGSASGFAPGFASGSPSGFGEASLAFQGPTARTLAPAHPDPAHPLGAAIAQVLDTYILAVSAAGSLVLVDQHAAHERLTHEALRAQLIEGGVRSQPLLLPAVVDLAPADAARLLAASQTLSRLGLELEGFGPGAILVRAMPAALGTPEPAPLLQDLADAFAQQGAPEDRLEDGSEAEATPLLATLDAVLARLACHGSIRAGRRLHQAEMDALLRRMEATPRAATCSHGRPTVLTLSRAEIEAMFGRR